MKDESESTIALILPLLLSPSLFWCLITYTTVLFFGLLAWAQIRSRNAKKLQMITWLESTNRIQVIMWHLSFYWWIQVMWSFAVLHSDFCWASNPRHGTQYRKFQVGCPKTQHWISNWPITFSKTVWFTKCDCSIYISVLHFCGQPTWNLRYHVICQRTELENLKMTNQNWGDVICDGSNCYCWSITIQLWRSRTWQKVGVRLWT